MSVLEPHICAVIPTFNNAGTILDVVQRVHQQIQDIIVVNDGSIDNTLPLLSTLSFPIVIVSFESNKGKGRALAAGFMKAKEHGFDYALTIDADGQHFPEDIPLMLSALTLHKGALIVGSRQFTDQNMAAKSKFANRFSNFWFRLQTTINLPDTQTGMRLYPLRRLYGLSLLTSRYEAELELLVFAAWHNVPIVSVPIRVYYPPENERVSHFRPVYDFTRISILNCFLCFGALLFGYVNMYWRTVVAFLYFSITMLFIVNPLSLIYFFIFGNNEHTQANYHHYTMLLAKHYCYCLKKGGGMRYEIHNPNNIQLAAHPSVIISNHQSFLDIMLYLSLSDKLIVVVKRYVWNNPVFAVVARKLGCFPVEMDAEKQQEHIEKIIKQGYSVLFFPEGTRSSTGDIGRFHRGAFYVAEQFLLPIQPLLLEGMTDFMNKRQFAIKPNDISLSILPEVAADDQSFGNGYRQRAINFERYYKRSLRNINS